MKTKKTYRTFSCKAQKAFTDNYRYLSSHNPKTYVLWFLLPFQLCILTPSCLHFLPFSHWSTCSNIEIDSPMDSLFSMLYSQEAGLTPRLEYIQGSLKKWTAEMSVLIICSLESMSPSIFHPPAYDLIFHVALSSRRENSLDNR